MTEHVCHRHGGARDESLIHINLTRKQLIRLIQSIKEKHPLVIIPPKK